MLRRFLFLLLALFWSTDADARFPRGGGSTVSGKAILNLGVADFIPSNVVNVLKTVSLNFTTPSDITKLNSSGYLTSSPTTNVGLAFPQAGTMYTNTQYKCTWPSTIQFKLAFNSNMSSCSVSGATMSGCVGGGGTLETTSGPGSLTFTTDTTQFSAYFVAGGTFSHSGGELACYRASDEGSYIAGDYSTSQYRAAIANARPRAIRPMGWVQRGQANFNGETTWANRVLPTNFSWLSDSYPPGAIAGGGSAAITRHVTLDQYSGAAQPDVPGAWTDGMQYIGVISATNTTTTPTLSITGLSGSKTIAYNSALPVTVGGDYPIVAGIGTFTYDAVLDKVLYNPGGIVASIPYEAQIQLASKLRVGLWAVAPQWASDNFVTSWATLLRDTTSLTSPLIFEYCNECWNYQFPQGQWSEVRGVALGWTTGSRQAQYGSYGLRVRQIMGNLIPTVFSGQMSRLQRFMGYQGFGDDTIRENQFLGTQLRSCTSFPSPCGNAVYDAYTGSANYSAKPDRPVDVIESEGGAPYAGGTNLCMGDDINCVPSALNFSFFQSLITASEAGDTAAVISAIDDDIRAGRNAVQTVTCVGTTCTTPLAHGYTANSTNIWFNVSGGTIYSGVAAYKQYQVGTTPLSNTFTFREFVGNNVTGSAINAGSAGTGTMNVGATNRNLVFTAGTFNLFAETLAASFDSDRPVGMNNLKIDLYEGNLEPKGLSAAQCVALSIVTAPPDVTGQDCADKIAAGIVAWKNDNKASLTQQAYFQQFVGTDASMPTTYGLMTHARSPSQLVLMCNSLYALIPGCLPDGQVYQTYIGYGAWSGGWLLKRDMILDESGAWGHHINDNDPMWLEKVA